MADAFHSHPRHERAKWDAKEKVFVIDGRPQFEGLTTPLGKAFWEQTFDSKKAWESRTDKNITKKRKRASSSKKGSTKESKTKKSKKGHSRKPHYTTYGQGRGAKLHAQVQKWVECETGVHSKSFKSRVRKIDDAVQAVIDECKNEDLEPLGSEKVVFDEGLKIATRIDVYCKHRKTSKLVTIELKFGFEGYSKISTGKMLKPLDTWPNHYYNQWQLQKLMEVHILLNRYDCKPEQMMPWIWWVHFDPKQKKYTVDKQTLEPATLAAHASVYAALKFRKQ